MTDSEIIKVLECCSKSVGESCLNCPLNESNCLEGNIEYLALDLIYRQKAEIERLNGYLDVISYSTDKIKAAVIQKCIEKIKARSAKVVATNNGIVVAGSTTYTISENELYNIKKEMVGDSDE